MGAARYLLVSFVTGITALGALVVQPLVRPYLRTWKRWQLRRAARYLGDRDPWLRSDTSGHAGWLGAHAGLGVGAAMPLLTSAGLAAAGLAVFGRTIWDAMNDVFGGIDVVAGILLFQLAVGAGFVFGVVGFVFPWFANALARASVATLTASPAEREAAQLAERVSILTSTRADALDAHSAELRRIERDLHDGAQAQLVALSLRLGVAEQHVANDSEAATLLREARTGAEEAMTDLRTVIRTMYPPILADRGLAGAISGLAARSIIPVHVSIDDLGDVPAPVEAAAYFVVAESVTNAIKHSGATQILIRVDRDLDGLHLQVTDDGVGGVDATQGTGILGIERRVAALDGATTIHSPIGGGTTITVELPCR